MTFKNSPNQTAKEISSKQNIKNSQQSVSSYIIMLYIMKKKFWNCILLERNPGIFIKHMFMIFS